MTLVALVAGCGNTAGLMLSDGTMQNVNSNEQPLSRPKYAASISASAKRCGFARAPEASKAAYLAFETKQGASKEELAKLEETYNLTWKSTYEQIGRDPVFCTQKKVAEIKLALRRQDANDYAPNFLKPEVASPPPPTVNEPFDSKTFWDEKDKEPSAQP
jgi:hypothetical protein